MTFKHLVGKSTLKRRNRLYHKVDKADLRGDATFGEVEKIINGINALNDVLILYI